LFHQARMNPSSTWFFWNLFLIEVLTEKM
jgi:hypothetical protein